MKARNVICTIEASSELGQTALKKYLKRALEKEGLIKVSQIAVQTVQPVKAFTEQEFAPGEGAYSDDE